MIRVIFNEEKCPWTLYVYDMRPNESAMHIRTLMDKHKKSEPVTNNNNVNSKRLTKKYATKFRDDPNCSAKSFIFTVQLKYFTKVSKQQLYRAKEKASEVMLENVMQQ